MFSFIICAALLALTTDVVQSKYVYHPEINGWIKAHHFIATWDEAYQKCRNEGFATLASPITKELRHAMTKLIGYHASTQYFIGTSSHFYPGLGFVSIEGVPLEDMEVSGMLSDLHPLSGQCLSMDGHKIRIVSCDAQLPFMCYKKEAESIRRNECGTASNVTGYKYYPTTGSCYKRHGDEEITWDEAYRACAAEGAHLVVINDAIEREVVHALTGDPKRVLQHYYVTIGMRDRTGNGDWMTVHGDRVEDVYNEWDIKKIADPRRRCGRIYTNGYLEVEPCDKKRPYVCETKPKDTLFPNVLTNKDNYM